MIGFQADFYKKLINKHLLLIVIFLFESQLLLKAQEINFSYYIDYSSGKLFNPQKKNDSLRISLEDGFANTSIKIIGGNKMLFNKHLDSISTMVRGGYFVIRKKRMRELTVEIDNNYSVIVPLIDGYNSIRISLRRSSENQIKSMDVILTNSIPPLD